MNIRLVVLLAIVAGLAFTGCFKHTFTVGAGAPNGRIVYQHWHHHWLFGIIGEDNLKIEQICPSGNATIHERTTFLNGLINALIGIVYSPTTVTIRCSDGSTAEIQLTNEQVSRIVTDPRFLDMVAELAPERLAEVELALALYNERSVKIARVE